MEIAKVSKKSTVVLNIIEQIKALYAIEKKAKEKNISCDQRHTLRQAEAIPLLEKLKTFLEEMRPKVLPKSPLGQAIGYTLRQWDSLTLYAQDGRISIGNNSVERCIRPFAVGRKNWLCVSRRRKHDENIMKSA